MGDNDRKKRAGTVDDGASCAGRVCKADEEKDILRRSLQQPLHTDIGNGASFDLGHFMPGERGHQQRQKSR